METRLRVTIDRVRETRKEYAAKRYFLFDAVVPRDRLLTMMRVIEHICTTYQFPITNTFHAGDGNIHPALFFSNGDADIENRLSGAWLDLLNTCAEVGGALTGEHGVGVEKRTMMQKFFDHDALQLMHSLREELGNEICNPHKIVPPTDVLKQTPPRRPGPGFHEKRILLDFPAAHMEVGCDVTLAEVIDVLASSPYQLPYYPIGADSDETVCNLIVRGCPSFKELRFGCPRDLLVGGLLTVLSGKQVRLGGIINKDVGGYELRKLIFNSRGKIGNLQRLILKLAPTPRAVTRISVDHASVKSTLIWMRELFFSTWGLSALFLRSAYTGVALEVIIEGSSETVSDGQKIVSDVVGTNAHMVVDQSAKLPDHPLRKTAEFRASSGQPWTRSDYIEGLVQRQIPFLAFAGSRFLLEPVNGASGVDRSSGADHQTDTLEGKVIRAFELL
jgi:FAD/FMN-containing dehydrogenase